MNQRLHPSTRSRQTRREFLVIIHLRHRLYSTALLVVFQRPFLSGALLWERQSLECAITRCWILLLFIASSEVNLRPARTCLEIWMNGASILSITYSNSMPSAYVAYLSCPALGLRTDKHCNLVVARSARTFQTMPCTVS